MVFKTLGTSLSNFINKSWTDTVKDFKISGISSLIKDSDAIALNQYAKALQSGQTRTEAFKNTLLGASSSAKKQAVEIAKLNTQYKSGAIDTKTYSAQLKTLGVETETVSLKTKLATTGFQMLKAVLSSIAFMFIIQGISYVVKGLSDLSNNVEKTKEKVKDLTDEFDTAISSANDNAKKTEDLVDDYEKLSKGVNNLGENVSLTNDEYDKYKSIVNEIADMFPNLIQGYDNEGNAILNLKGNVEQLRDAYKEAQKEAYNLLITGGKNGSGKDIIKQWQDTQDTNFWAKLFGGDKVGKGISVSNAIDLLKTFEQMDLDRFRELPTLMSGALEEVNGIAPLTDSELDLATSDFIRKTLGITDWNITEEDFINAKKQAKALIQTYNVEIEIALSDVKSLANAYLMTNDDYDKLDEQSKTSASIIVNSLDENIANDFKTKTDVSEYVNKIIEAFDNADVKDAINNLFTLDTSNMSVNDINSQVDKYINVIASAIGEDSDKLKIRLGFDDTDDILNRAKAKFNIQANSAMKGLQDEINNFLGNLTLDDLNIAMQIPDLFDDGLSKASEKIADFKADPNNNISVSTDTKSIDDMLEAVEDYSKSANTYVKNQKTVTDALSEQSKYGKLASDTVIELSDAGYSSALVYDKVTGAVTLNEQAVKNLNLQKQSELKLDLIKEKSEIEQKYKDEASSVADLQREMATANETRREAIRLEIAEKSANMAEYYEMMSQYEGLINSISNYTPTQSDGSSKSSDPWKEKFEKEYNEKQHLLNMNQITEDEYINWLDGAYKQYFSDLTKYQDEYNKYEEEVYKSRTDREQKLFDRKIDNLEKLADKALDDNVDGNGNELTVTASFDYAREQINSAISDIQTRIEGIKNGTISGNADDIEQLSDDLDSLYDKLSDINEKEIDSQKEYIKTLKDEYSDLIDEQIDQQKKLADNIEKAYEKQIDNIDKQIDAINKVNEAEERQKNILEAQQAVKEAQRDLDKANRNTRLVYTRGGNWEPHSDKDAVEEVKKNLADKQTELEKARDEQKIAVLEEQKEVLENQKNASKDYYDKVTSDLEEQKTAREKQYDLLIDIYEQLGGEKKQTSLNNNLVAKLTANGDINKAVQSLTPTELQQAIQSGVLTTDSDGNYAVDYSILGENEKAVNDNTAELKKAETELEKLTNSLSGDTSNTNHSATSKVDATKPHLDANGYLVDANGKQILNDDKPIHAKKKEDSNKGLKKTDLKVPRGDGEFAGYNSMNDLFKAMSLGEFSIPQNIVDSFKNTNLPNKITEGMSKLNEQVVTNSEVSNNNSPIINLTVNVEGSADEKTVGKIKSEVGNMLVDYTNYMSSSMSTAMLRQKNKS